MGDDIDLDAELAALESAEDLDGLEPEELADPDIDLGDDDDDDETDSDADIDLGDDDFDEPEPEPEPEPVAAPRRRRGRPPKPKPEAAAPAARRNSGAPAGSDLLSVAAVAAVCKCEESEVRALLRAHPRAFPKPSPRARYYLTARQVRAVVGKLWQD